MAHFSLQPRLELLENRLLLTGTPQMVADVATAPVADLSGAFVDNGQYFFYASEKHTGRELWQSDGTEAGTRIVHDFAPGPDDATVESLGIVGQHRLFVENGRRLFAVNETNGQTTLLANISSHVGGNEQRHFFLIGSELWTTDGTAAGTVAIHDESRIGEAVYSPAGGLLFRPNYEAIWHVGHDAAITPLFDVFLPSRIGNAFDSTIIPVLDGWLFAGRSGVHSNVSIWFTDGTIEGTDIIYSEYRSSFRLLGEATGQVAFDAGGRVVLSDGTASGTRTLLRHHRNNFVGANESGLYFRQVNEDRSDLVRFVDAGEPEFVASLDSINTQNLGTLPDGRFLYRNVLAGENRSYSLGISDGTSNGTQLLPVEPLTVRPEFEFASDKESQRFVIKIQTEGETFTWISDGTSENTWQFATPDTVGVANVSQVLIAQDSVFIVENSTNGQQVLWEIKPDSKTPRRVSSASEFGPIKALNGSLRFLAQQGNENHLWHYSWEANELRKIRNLEASNEDADIARFVAVGNQLFFVKDQSEVWVSDGTPDGTRQLQPPREMKIESVTDLVGRDNDLLVLSRANNVGPFTIWRTDGTNEGTQIVKEDISHAMDLHFFNDETFFSSAGTAVKLSQSGESELLPFSWWFDPVRLNDQEVFVPIRRLTMNTATLETRKLDVSNRISDATNFGNRVAFNSEGKVWSTDGTEDVVLVEGVARDFKPVGNHVVFLANDKFYLSDGTSTGTSEIPITLPPETGIGDFHYTNETLLVFEATGDFRARRLFAFRSGETHEVFTAPGRIYNAIVVGDSLYFASDQQLWVTDGTTSGTRQIDGVFPVEPTSRRETEVVFADDQLFFLADDGIYGEELWRVPLSDEPITGDANRDGEVSFADFLLLSANFGEEVFPTEKGDLNGDGSVSFADFLLLAAEFQQA